MKTITKYFCLVMAGSLLLGFQQTTSSLQDIISELEGFTKNMYSIRPGAGSALDLALTQQQEQKPSPAKSAKKAFLEALETGNEKLLDLYEDNYFKTLDKKGRSYLHNIEKKTGTHAPRMIIYLVQKRGLDIHQRDNKGNKPIMYSKTLKTLKTFISLDNASSATNNHEISSIFFNTIMTTNNAGESLLHRAVALNNHEMVRYLLKNGLIKWVNKQNVEGETPLFYLNPMADEKDDSLIIAKDLLEHGAIVDAKDFYGNTAFMDLLKEAESSDNLLIFNNYLQTLTFLLKNGADINAENNQQESPINLLSFKEGYSILLTNFLAKEGANLDHPCKKTLSLASTVTLQLLMPPCAWAFYQNKPKIARELINKGADWKWSHYGKSLLKLLDSGDSTKKQFRKLLPILYRQITKLDIKLPFKEQKPSPILCKAFIHLLEQGKVLPTTPPTDTLQKVCLKFLIAFNKNTNNNDLTLSPEEKHVCSQHFTIDPLGFRDTILWQQQQQKDMNNMISSQAKQTSRFKKGFLHDLKINFNA